MFNNIPEEMKAFKQFICWRYEEFDGEKPTKVPYDPISGYPAKVNDESTWRSFDECFKAVSEKDYNGIGFVLSENDPYCFIDLDDTGGDPKVTEIQMKIYETFDSYSEISPSGKGLHIIVKGSVPSGRKRSKIEIYSDLRFMTMTGNVYRKGPIRDYNELANRLWADMGRNTQYEGHDPKAPQTMTDEEVINMCLSAENGRKVADLASGNWQDYYPSQSEADLALVNIISFYTQNREQITRLFKASALGVRDKTTTIRGIGYIDYMINKSFDRILPPVDLEALQNNLRAAIEENLRNNKPIINVSETRNINVVEKIEPCITSKPVRNFENVEAYIKNNRESVYSFPPGLVGEIALFIFEQSPRPVKEIALAGAIAYMSGIIGRCYNVSNTGLNQYVMLLAKTGRGKEAIASGIDKLVSRVVRTVPTAEEFIGPSEISSPPALARHLSKTPSIVSLMGEVGLRLKQLSSQRATPIELGLRRMILDLYNKSGEGKVIRPTVYSDKDKNIENLYAPAFSIMGESTPEKFYDALDASMISEGLLPRFFTIEYYGLRPPLNENHYKVEPSDSLINKLATICANAQMLNSQNKAIHVQSDYEATQILNDFNKFCDNEINSSSGETRAELWNRAHMKVLRLAATVAVGLNPWEPTITADVANWAINIIVLDVRNIVSKFDQGDIMTGDDEEKQHSVLIQMIRVYITEKWQNIAVYGTSTKTLHDNKIIPHAYLLKRCQNSPVFKRDKRGAALAFKLAMQSFVESGYISKLPASQSMKYNTSAACYVVSNPTVFI